MRTKFTSGDPVTTHDGVEYTTKGFADTGKRITHYTNEGLGSPTSTTYQDTEQHLFALPDLLVGDKILEIGAKYTNNQISAKITAAAAVGNGPVLTESGIAHRIKTAMAKKALEQNVSVDDFKETFRQSRRSNGVATRAARVPRAKKSGQMTLTGTSVKDDDEADKQSAAYEQDFGGERKNSAISEMTEFESDEEA